MTSSAFTYAASTTVGNKGVRDCEFSASEECWAALAARHSALNKGQLRLAEGNSVRGNMASKATCGPGNGWTRRSSMEALQRWCARHWRRSVAARNAEGCKSSAQCGPRATMRVRPNYCVGGRGRLCWGSNVNWRGCKGLCLHNQDAFHHLSAVSPQPALPRVPDRLAP